MRDLQNDARKIISFFQKALTQIRRVNMNLLTDGLIRLSRTCVPERFLGYPDSLKSRKKFLAGSDWADSVSSMIRSGFLSEEDRKALTALAQALRATRDRRDHQLRCGRERKLSECEARGRFEGVGKRGTAAFDAPDRRLDRDGIRARL